MSFTEVDIWLSHIAAWPFSGGHHSTFSSVSTTHASLNPQCSHLVQLMHPKIWSYFVLFNYFFNVVWLHNWWSMLGMADNCMSSSNSSGRKPRGYVYGIASVFCMFIVFPCVVHLADTEGGLGILRKKQLVDIFLLTFWPFLTRQMSLRLFKRFHVCD